ncbi:MAG TPA: deaminase [Conexibacter sp.]|nr:deaminase [Conexibacter sp.]
MFVVGPELYMDYRPLAKDIRALPADAAAAAIAAWAICSDVAILTPERAAELVAEQAQIVMPAEDVSYQLTERLFPRNEVRYDTIFLRWDKTKTVQLLQPRAHRTTGLADDVAELADAAEAAATRSIDWWRQVGAAIRFCDGDVRAVSNAHGPHPLSAYAAGDPRSNFYKGVALELSTVTHAEARLIAEAARDGKVTSGATLYVTDFPCPPCAKLIAASGIARLFYREGYAVLDGVDVLEDAGVEIVAVSAQPD